MNRRNLIRRFLEFLKEMGREKQLAKINFVVLTSTDAARIVPRNKNCWWTVESIFSMVSVWYFLTVSYEPQLEEDFNLYVVEYTTSSTLLIK